MSFSRFKGSGLKASDFIWSFIKPCATSFCFSLLSIVYFHIQTDYYHMFMNDGTFFFFDK